MKRDEPMNRSDSSRVGGMRVKWRSVVAGAGFTTFCLSARQSLADEQLFGFTRGIFGFDVAGPPGASVVIQAKHGPAKLDSAANQSARQRPALFLRSAVPRQRPPFLPRPIIAVKPDV